jgi:peptidoglycan/LPS O-acetylase OafA/YrhL
MRLEYYKSLDGIRANAAFMVIFLHFFKGQFGISVTTDIWKIFDKISIVGQAGVTLFFVLSGFLITRILLSTKENENYFKVFYMRRVLRIFPLYYFFLLCYYFLPLLWNGVLAPLRDQFCYYTYLQSFSATFRWKADGPGHFWSLAVEEHFYLFWPLIVYYLSTKNLYRVIWGIIVMAILLRIYMLNQGYEVYYFTFTRFDSLAIGALLALMETKDLFKRENARKFLVLILLLSIPTAISWIFLTGHQNILVQVFKYDFVSFSFFGFIGIVLCVNQRNWFNRILTSNFFSYSGKISYGLYVYHPFAFVLSVKLFHFSYWPLTLLGGVGMTFLIAAMSFHFFEDKFLSMKKFFKYETKTAKLGS